MLFNLTLNKYNSYLPFYRYLRITFPRSLLGLKYW